MKGLFSSVKTKEASVEVIASLSEIFNKSYNSKNITQSIKADIKTFGKVLPNELVKKLLGFKTPESLRKYLTELQDSLKKAPVLTVSLAIVPSEVFIEKIYKWFDKSGCKNFLLDMKQNDAIFGGCQVSWQGKFTDLSLLEVVKKFVK